MKLHSNKSEAGTDPAAKLSALVGRVRARVSDYTDDQRHVREQEARALIQKRGQKVCSS